jgi:hypothetical protein
MVKVLMRSLIWVALSCPLIGGAHTIKVDPSSLSVFGGQTFTVDVLATDLDSTGPGSFLSSFELVLGYDATRLSEVGVSFGTALGDGGLFEALYGETSGAGSIDLSGLSLLLDADLLSRQHPDPNTNPTLKLASVTFKALGLNPGEDVISTDVSTTVGQLLGGCAVPDANGGCSDSTPFDVTSSTQGIGTTVRVSPPPTGVPEPMTVWLLVSSLLCMTWMRRQNMKL